MVYYQLHFGIFSTFFGKHEYVCHGHILRSLFKRVPSSTSPVAKVGNVSKGPCITVYHSVLARKNGCFLFIWGGMRASILENHCCLEAELMQ